MTPTRFWLLRHALVTPAARAVLYGRMDVDICEDTATAQAATYAALAARLPRNAAWVVTPLRRTQQTAREIHRAGYPAVEPLIEDGLTEQDLGHWQGLPHGELPARLRQPAHAFWPLGATETPPGGESMQHVVHRVGAALERLAGTAPHVVAVSHGGAIRAAVAHAMGANAHQVLHLSVQNLSLTVLERVAEGWRVISVNEASGAECRA